MQTKAGCVDQPSHWYWQGINDDIGLRVKIGLPI